MKNLDFETCDGREGTSSGYSDNDRWLLSDKRERIERTVRYMRQHLNQPLHASDLAAVANLSLSHYFALFKRAIGCAPIDFFIRLRMKHACHLLETTSLTVKEIAGELGYDDPFYFSRLFKSVNSVAPSDYRRAYQNGIEANKNVVSSDESPEWDWGNTRLDRIVHGKQSIFHSVSNAI